MREDFIADIIIQFSIGLYLCGLSQSEQVLFQFGFVCAC